MAAAVGGRGTHKDGCLMVEMTDITLIEAKGNFPAVCRLMREDGSPEVWMLETVAYVTAPMISSQFVLHCWNDGKVVMFDAMRPLQMETPIDDLQQLREWCKNNKWSDLWIHDRLLVERKSLFYWSRMYIAGLVMNDRLKKQDDDEHARLTSAYIKEKEEEEQENAP